MSVVVRTPQAQVRMVSKGAVEEILKVCSHVELQGEIKQLSPALCHEIQTITQNYNREGLRVVAVAYRNIDTHQESFSVADERDLILMGYLTF